jgi:F0F1-type ATP synthase membrane subunit c/vacuolar-type H+-ATPase subunit K
VARDRSVIVHLPPGVAAALAGVAGANPEPFILDAVVEALARRRRHPEETVAMLRAAAGLWTAYDDIPADPAGIVAYVRARRP